MVKMEDSNNSVENSKTNIWEFKCKRMTYMDLFEEVRSKPTYKFGMKVIDDEICLKSGDIVQVRIMKIDVN